MWGIPAVVMKGNFLDKAENLSGWKNIHWMRVGEDKRREWENRIELMKEFFEVSEDKPVDQRQSEPDLEHLADVVVRRDDDQVFFDFK